MLSIQSVFQNCIIELASFASRIKDLSTGLDDVTFSHTEYLIQTHNILALLLHSNLATNLALITGGF